MGSALVLRCYYVTIAHLYRASSGHLAVEKKADRKSANETAKRHFLSILKHLSPLDSDTAQCGDLLSVKIRPDASAPRGFTDAPSEHIRMECASLLSYYLFDGGGRLGVPAQNSVAQIVERHLAKETQSTMIISRIRATPPTG